MKLKYLATFIVAFAFLSGCVTQGQLDKRDARLRSEIHEQIESSHLTTKMEMRAFEALVRQRVPVLNVSLERESSKLAWKGYAVIRYGKGTLKLPLTLSLNEDGTYSFEVSNRPLPADDWSSEAH